MKIVCDHCKNEFEACPSCGSGDIERKINFNIIFLVVVFLSCIFSAYRWYSALDSYERAQRLRRAYLKEKIESRPTLPFAK